MFLLRAWYGKAPWLYLLWPLALLFRALTALRRAWLSNRAQASPLPTIIIGNISLGGTGKTPMVIALALALKAKGWRPGIVSRAYGVRLPQQPYRLRGDESAQQVGDEALVIHRHTGCPVVLDPDRPRAVQNLADSGDCDLIISDDGLQHYAMARDIEIVLIDGQRGLGNALCLPAGPLREAPSRLRQVDHVVINGAVRPALPYAPRDTVTHLSLRPRAWVNLQDGAETAPEALPEVQADTVLQALAGIGNPDRFFDLLTSLGYRIERHVFDDHHPYRADDLAQIRQSGTGPVVMTEKDAVKCMDFAAADCWYLAVDAVADPALIEAVDLRLKQLSAE